MFNIFFGIYMLITLVILIIEFLYILGDNENRNLQILYIAIFWPLSIIYFINHILK